VTANRLAGIQAVDRRRCNLASDVAALFDRYGPMVLRRCRRMLRDEQQAAEAMQDVFTRLVFKELDVKHPSSLLFRMATHECLTRLRTRRRRPEVQLPSLAFEIANTPDVDARLDAQAALDWLFAREPASTQTIAVMFLMDGMTWEQIAHELDMSVSGVRKRLRRLRQHLPELEAM
jgi:RNA polymerase sigma-70 factor (ECF subfamily)